MNVPSRVRSGFVVEAVRSDSARKPVRPDALPAGNAAAGAETIR
ncbi:hypothetical protein [Streptomyces sp. NPDC058291]